LCAQKYRPQQSAQYSAQYRLFFFLAFYAAKRAPRSQAKKNITRRRTLREEEHIGRRTLCAREGGDFTG
jgi:hypothetical protein